jgi:hypothetical protein
MNRLAALLLACLSAASCAVGPPVDTSMMPSSAFGSGNQDPPTAALNVSSWAFADPARTRNNPGEAARAVASVDYLAGDLNTSPRWDFVSPITKHRMLLARAEVRNAIGVVPTAPSQEVVNRLLGVTQAAYARDQAAELAALQSPIFALGPPQTLDRLANLPYLPETNVATLRANAQINLNSEHSCMPCF